MAKQHDDWLSYFGDPNAADLKVKGKVGHTAVTVKTMPDGLGLGAGYEDKIKLGSKPFFVGPLPAYVKAELKFGVEGEGTAKGLTQGERVYKLSVGVYAKGVGELGLGASNDMFTVSGPFAQLGLGIKDSITFTHAESKGWSVEPLTFSVYAEGALGAKVEWQVSGKKFDLTIEKKIAALELYVVQVHGWKNGRLHVTSGPGKDWHKVEDAFRDPGRHLEDAARWIAESETAKKIADKTGEVLDEVKEKTGIDAGQIVEDGVARALGEKTKAQREAASEQQRQAEAALRAEFEAETSRRRIRPGQALVAFRTPAEWTKLTEAMAHDVECIYNDQTPAKRWLEMLERLDGIMLDRRTKQALDTSRAKSADARADWMRKVDAAKLKAEGNGNWLSSRISRDPSDPVHRLFEVSRRLKNEGDGLRQTASTAEGDACEAAAKGAIAKYQQALTGFIKGQQMVKAAAKQAEPA
jgi:hypothetical protein